MKPCSERLAVIATSFRRVGLGRLGDYVLPPEAVAEQAALRDALGAEELVYLATCNRVECYVALPHPLRPDDLQTLAARARAFFAARGATVDDEALFAAHAEDAITHLLTVSSGLDSLVLGETEICGQARRAHERCASAGLSGPALAQLFEQAARCSRRAKNETALGRTPTSAATIAVEKIRKYFGADGPGVTVLVGVGEMTRKVAQALQGRPGERIFVNRTLARAEELARRFGGTARSLDELLAAPPARLDLLFSATSATETVIPPGVLAPALASRAARGASAPLVVCDLGLPRDVCPTVDALDGVRVVDMRTIEALAQRGQAALEVEAARARAIVREETARFVREDRYRRVAAESARALLESRLAHLSAEDRETVLSFATSLASRIARQPGYASAPSAQSPTTITTLTPT
jgi:glutamyl-tRNA reductase